MSDESRTFTLAIDPALHDGREPESEVQRITWETLDTVWNVLRESAVRLTLVEIRAQLKEQGFEQMPSDEAMFEAAKASGDPDAPKSYLDLAPQRGDGPAVELAGQGLLGAFQLLADQAMVDASEGLGFAMEERGE